VAEAVVENMKEKEVGSRRCDPQSFLAGNSCRNWRRIGKVLFVCFAVQETKPRA
jgi:hypothetical protein